MDLKECERPDCNNKMPLLTLANKPRRYCSAACGSIDSKSKTNLDKNNKKLRDKIQAIKDRAKQAESLEQFTEMNIDNYLKGLTK